MAKGAGSLSQRLRGIHHVGITVEDMGKALEFYTEVLGGQLIISEEGLAGDTMHNTLLQKEELEAAQAGIDPQALAVPNLRDGRHLLDSYFIQFSNFVVELLQYRDASAPPKGAVPYPAKHPHGSSPTYVNAMHVSFYLNDDVDADQFVADLEAECERRGMPQVRCNRIVRVTSEEERRRTEARYRSCKLVDTPEHSFGEFSGWTLFYCKGPSGEQLEFNQVLGKAKALFTKAQARFTGEPQADRR